MRAISKQELLKMLDNHLTDDALISATSVMAGEAFEITPDLIAHLIPDLDVLEEETGCDEETLDGATFVLYTP